MQTTEKAKNKKVGAKGIVAPATTYDPKNPNSILTLDFNYQDPNGFTGEEWKRYNEMLEQLCPLEGIMEHTNTMFEFQLWRAEPILVLAYPELPAISPKHFVGVRIKSTAEPLHTTRISIATARIYNAQMGNPNKKEPGNAHALAGYGKYYLLKIIGK